MAQLLIIPQLDLDKVLYLLEKKDGQKVRVYIKQMPLLVEVFHMVNVFKIVVHNVPLAKDKLIIVLNVLEVTQKVLLIVNVWIHFMKMLIKFVNNVHKNV